MAKITLSRIFELSRYLATKAGQELEGPLTYLAEFSELTIRNLRNGLSFSDNFDCESKRVTLRHNTEIVISITNKAKRAQRIYIDRVVSNTYFVITSFGWKYSAQGDIIIKASFDGPPPATLDIETDIVIHFG